MKKFGFSIIVCFYLMALLFMCCSPAQPLSPADFSVLTLNVSPQEVQPGGKVTVTAEVANMGGLPGNFDEPLMVNGKQAAVEPITIQPGYSRTLTCTFSQVESGKYSVQLGARTTHFIVVSMVEQQVELKYDNGTSKDALWAGNNGGFLISFDPPGKPFTLKKVRICGGVYGTGWEGKSFELFVLDSDMKSIIDSQSYVVAKFPVRSAFPYQPPVWVDFNIPDASINNKFFVYLYTSMNRHYGIHVGVDDSVENQNSFLAQGKPPGVAVVNPTTQYVAGVWYSDITRLNWMIRAYGTTLVPQ